MMITKIVYNCNQESLGDVSQAEFVDAFENEVRVKPIYRDLQIEVTFASGQSEVVSFSSDDTDADLLKEDAFREWFHAAAERAFAACLA